MRRDVFARLARRAVRRTVTEHLYLSTGLDFTRPNDIRATLTERCNYACLYCDHWRQDHYPPEMDLDDWKAALGALRNVTGPYAVQFLGGEPTIVPWFLDLVEFCSGQGIDWGVITNGSTLSQNMARRIAAASPLNVDISIDSRQAAAHDEARGVKRSLAHIDAGMQRLLTERELAPHRFVIRIKPTVHRLNAGHLVDLLDWAEGLPFTTVDFSPVRLTRDSERALLYPSSEDELRVLSDQVEELIRRKAAGSPVETSEAKLRSMVAHFEGRPIQHGVGRCRVGLRSLDIRPNGDVRHCWRFKIGNVRTTPMEQIWASAERQEIIGQSLACSLFKETCSTACTTHRTFLQDVGRGLQLLKGAQGS